MMTHIPVRHNPADRTRAESLPARRVGYHAAMRRRLTAGILALLAAALAVLASGCVGDVSTTTPEGAGITAAGVGRVSAEPDVAVVGIGADATERTVAAARDRSASAMTAIRDSLAAAGVEDRDIRTTDFSIYPQFDYRGDGPPRLTGFTVSNRAEVRIRAVDRTAAILDDAIAAAGDAVRVGNIRFEVDDPAPLIEEARRLAMADARAKAEQLAGLANVGLGDARTVVETSADAPQPRALAGNEAFAAAADAAASTPISPGEGEVAVSVLVVYAIE